MSGKNEKLMQALLQAIKSENDGHFFYLMAAKQTADPKGREVFDLLAQEELRHRGFLRNQYRSVLETGGPDPNLLLGHAAQLDGPHPIFSDALIARAKDAHYEMTALSVGIQLELNSQHYYQSQAADAADEVARKLFSELAVWEGVHYEMLSRQLEALKEAYWAVNSFSPY